MQQTRLVKALVVKALVVAAVGTLCASCGGEDLSIASLSSALGPWSRAVQGSTMYDQKCWSAPANAEEEIEMTSCPGGQYWATWKTWSIYMNGDWYKFKSLWSPDSNDYCVESDATGDRYTFEVCDDDEERQDFDIPNFSSQPSKIIPRADSAVWAEAEKDGNDYFVRDTDTSTFKWSFPAP